MTAAGTPFRLAHLSDLHVLDLSGARPRDFLNKRLAGGATLLLQRRGAHRIDVTEAAVRSVLACGVDHVLVTGDLSNLSLESELSRAAEILEPLGDARRLSVVPGNHDCYTREARCRFERLFARWLVGDPPGERPWPYLKLLGPVALVGVSSALPTPWPMSSGRIGREQGARLEALLGAPELAGRLRVVALHHPLRNSPFDPMYGLRALRGAGALRRRLTRGGVDLVLHGHNHVAYRRTCFAGGSGFPIHTAASTSLGKTGNPARRGRYAVYEVGADGRDVRIAEEHAWDPALGEFVRMDGAGVGRQT